MNNGWILLHRQLQNKGYYKDSEYVHLWLHLLFEAKWEDTEFLYQGQIIEVKKGQLITGRKKLSEQTGINESKITRILSTFVKCGQIEQQTTNKFRLITVKNYDKFQTYPQQMNNKRTTSEHNKKNIKNINKYNFQKIKKLHDNTEAVWKFGKWVDPISGAEINPSYYPEITKW